MVYLLHSSYHTQIIRQKINLFFQKFTYKSQVFIIPLKPQSPTKHTCNQKHSERLDLPQKITQLHHSAKKS